MTQQMPYHSRRTTAWLWVVCLLGLSLGHTRLWAQEGLWEAATAAGVQALAQQHYAAAEQHFLAALARTEPAGPEVPRRVISLQHLATTCERSGKYQDAVLFYQQALALQEQLLGPDDLQLVELLHAYAGLLRKVSPGRSRWPWSTASQLEYRARQIMERDQQANAPAFPASGFDESGIFRDGS